MITCGVSFIVHSLNLSFNKISIQITLYVLGYFQFQITFGPSLSTRKSKGIMSNFIEYTKK